jgi:hypothetical protein
MLPIFSSRAQTNIHGGKQIELHIERDRNGGVARFLLIYAIVSVTIKVKGVNAHHDVNPDRIRWLRWLVRLLHLIGREGSRRELPSLERHTQGPLPLYLQTLVCHWTRP